MASSETRSPLCARRKCERHEGPPFLSDGFLPWLPHGVHNHAAPNIRWEGKRDVREQAPCHASGRLPALHAWHTPAFFDRGGGWVQVSEYSAVLCSWFHLLKRARGSVYSRPTSIAPHFFLSRLKLEMHPSPLFCHLHCNAIKVSAYSRNHDFALMSGLLRDGSLSRGHHGSLLR